MANYVCMYALCGNFAYLNNLYALIEEYTNFVVLHFGS